MSYTESQIAVEVATPPNDTLLRVAIFTGLRRGELFALQWGDIDWGNSTDGGHFWIKRSLYHGAITSPKTEHSNCVVDVPQRILDELAVYREMYPPKQKDFIFHTASGTPIDPDNWYKRRFLPLLERGGLRRVGLHALYHTYASLLIN